MNHYYVKFKAFDENEFLTYAEFKTLDNRIVDWNGSFDVFNYTYREDDCNFLEKYFKESNKVFNLNVYSGIVIEDEPIWAVAYHIPPEYCNLNPNRKLSSELNYIDYYTSQIVIPTIYRYYKSLNSKKDYIIDVRKMYYYFNTIHRAFIPPDITHTLPDDDSLYRRVFRKTKKRYVVHELEPKKEFTNNVHRIQFCKNIISDFPYAVKKQEKFNKIAELYRKSHEH